MQSRLLLACSAFDKLLVTPHLQPDQAQTDQPYPRHEDAHDQYNAHPLHGRNDIGVCRPRDPRERKRLHLSSSLTDWYAELS